MSRGLGDVYKRQLSIFSLGNSVKIPVDPIFKILGTLILNGVVVVLLVGNVLPSLIPETVCTDVNDKVLPSADIPVTLL